MSERPEKESSPPDVRRPGVRGRWSVRRHPTTRTAGLLIGLVGFAVILLAPAPPALGPVGWRVAAVAVLMASWWVTEVIPIPATSLLPLALFPLLGVGSIRESAAPYAHPLVFLFLGGFILALAMERWGLPKRIALRVIQRIGTNPRAIVAGFMVSGAFLSMWVSNTATAIMMLPIAISLLELLKEDARSPMDDGSGLKVVLMLGIAYGCSIGGLGTLIGTPPNAFLAGFMEESYGRRIGFAEWMLFGIPVVLVGLPVAYMLLTRVAFRVGAVPTPGAAAYLDEQLSSLGRMSRPERRVLAVFLATALLWVSRPLLSSWIPGLSDPGIAITAAIALFLIPSGSGKSSALLDWSSTERLPWGTLVLFGGGLSLAAAFQRSGLTDWIGGAFTSVAGDTLLLPLAVVVVTMVLLTELTSNTATAAALLPVIGSVAFGLGLDPLLFAAPATLAASCAFMLPVATGPNVIVYGSGLIEIRQMVRAGLLLNLAFVLVILAAAYLLLPLVFDVPLRAPA